MSSDDTVYAGQLAAEQGSEPDRLSPGFTYSNPIASSKGDPRGKRL